MKAVVIHAPGAPEQLVMAEVPEPEPGPGEVLVDVAFAGCNWADTQIRTGIYPHARTYPLVLGLEIAGTVARSSGLAYAMSKSAIVSRRFSSAAAPMRKRPSSPPIC